MYVEGNLKTYLDDLAAKKAAPGGGSAAAAAGALGAALLGMVANFTVGKEKYKDVEAEIQGILAKSEELRNRLEKLIDEDVAVYQKVSAAYKLPKETDEEKKMRTSSIQDALKEALKVPHEVCRACLGAIRLSPLLLEKGNRNLVSDVGVAAEFLASAFQSALLNVEINLAGIKDDELKSRLRTELDSQEKEIAEIRENVVKGTKEAL